MMGNVDAATNSTSEIPPLYVDLDGTLCRADTMQQAAIQALRDHPLQAVRALIALLKSRHAAKDVIAETVDLDPAALPYREAVIDYVKQAKQQGRRVVLATGSHRKYADAVAKYLGLFDAVYATENGTNLIGENKLLSIRADCGEKDFEYLGDSGQDLVIFEASAVAGMVGGRRFDPLANTKVRVHRLAHVHNDTLRDLVRLLRPHQWVKNALVFMPLAASHRLSEWALIWESFAAFVVMCLVASGNYVLNDLLDMQSDRRHPTKRQRPVASGSVTIPRAVLLAVMLISGGLALAGVIGAHLLVATLAYLLLANLYSFFLKRRLLIDVVALAAMYTLRPIAGSAATGIVPSPWLLAFCMFFFACLALAKRYTELQHQLATSPDTEPDASPEEMRRRGRAYFTTDLDILRVVGPVNGYLAVMVVALYISNPVVTVNYQTPQLLWLICPVLAYWVTRVWFFAHRGALHDDPVVFALRDIKSYLALLICAAIAVCAAKLKISGL